jgi:hypothetical protein
VGSPSDERPGLFFVGHSLAEAEVMLQLMSVNQYVLVWDLRQNINCLKCAVLSLWGALSEERSGLSLVSDCQK